MKWLQGVIQGIFIGVANIIPGVSGGTLMVSMGIYDTLIHAVTHILKQFKKSILLLLPYLLGMAAGIAGLAFAVTFLLENAPLPTNACFIGLILGGIPLIIKKGEIRKGGIRGMVIFIIFFAIVVLLEVFGHQESGPRVLTTGFAHILLLIGLGAIASATMIIPGVSGSMILMLLGYYHPVVAAVKNAAAALISLDIHASLSGLAVLLPFGVGILVGLFAVAKLIEALLLRRKTLTYCAILGLVAASPVAILLATGLNDTRPLTIIISAVTLLAGFTAAHQLCGKGGA
jgi:putative membrane protein